jgi:hypothetical protein
MSEVSQDCGEENKSNLSDDYEDYEDSLSEVLNDYNKVFYGLF